MLAKTESADQVAGLSPRRVVALCETPRGVLAATAIAACPTTVAMMWGAEDLVAALGGRSSRRPDGPYGDVARHARAQVLLSAGAYGVAAIDAVHLDIGDLDGLRGEATDAAASGFVATACIHPSQVAVVRERLPAHRGGAGLGAQGPGRGGRCPRGVLLRGADGGLAGAAARRAHRRSVPGARSADRAGGR